MLLFLKTIPLGSLDLHGLKSTTCDTYIEARPLQTITMSYKGAGEELSEPARVQFTTSTAASLLPTETIRL